MFYERFLQLCKDNNEKPTNVLKSIGVSSGNLNNWKNGTSVKSDILMQLSEHFNVSIDYLLGKVDDPQSTTITIEDIMVEFLKLSKDDKIKVMNWLEKTVDTLGIEPKPLTDEQLKLAKKYENMYLNDDN